MLPNLSWYSIIFKHAVRKLLHWTKHQEGCEHQLEFCANELGPFYIGRQRVRTSFRSDCA